MIPWGQCFGGLETAKFYATSDFLCDLEASHLPSLCLSPLRWDHNIYRQAVLGARMNDYVKRPLSFWDKGAMLTHSIPLLLLLISIIPTQMALLLLLIDSPA